MAAVADDVSLMDPTQMHFEYEWHLGRLVAHKKRFWKPEPVCSFKTVHEFWALYNLVLGDNFQLNTSTPERWLFRTVNGQPTMTHFETVEEATGTPDLIELTIKQPTKELMRDVIICIIGCEIVHCEDIVGIRIKPYRNGGDIRVWITNKSTMGNIAQFFMENFNVHLNEDDGINEPE